MATISVHQTLGNPARVGTTNKNCIYQMMIIVNALSTAMNALTSKMDTDFADVTNASVDYASTIGTMDTLDFLETGAPS